MVVMKDEIWKYGTGFFKVYTSSKDLKKKLLKVKGCNLSCMYFFPTGWDCIFPSKLYKKINKIMVGK